MKQEAICILGMHRCGTSLVARIVQQLGVYLGRPDNFYVPNFDNPDGFFENKFIKEIHDNILKSLESSWDNPMPLAEKWWLQGTIQLASYDLGKFIDSEFGDCKIWGWKDPRTCLLFPVWEEILDARDIKIKLIIPIRNPLDVAKSLAARNGFHLIHGLRLWYYYTLSLLPFTQKYPCLFVDYDQLIDKPDKIISAIQNFIFCGDAVNSIETAVGFIKKDMRHHQSKGVELELYGQGLLDLYQACQYAAVTQTPVSKDVYVDKLCSYKESAWLLNAHVSDDWYRSKISSILATKNKQPEDVFFAANKDQIIKTLLTLIAEKDQTIQVLTTLNVEKQEILALITQNSETKASAANIVLFLWRVRLALAPQGSKREQTGYRLFMYLRHIKASLGWPQTRLIYRDIKALLKKDTNQNPKQRDG